MKLLDRCYSLHEHEFKPFMEDIYIHGHKLQHRLDSRQSRIMFNLFRRQSSSYGLERRTTPSGGWERRFPDRHDKEGRGSGGWGGGSEGWGGEKEGEGTRRGAERRSSVRNDREGRESGGWGGGSEG